jgi:hypothetical protein
MPMPNTLQVDIKIEGIGHINNMIFGFNLILILYIYIYIYVCVCESLSLQ